MRFGKALPKPAQPAQRGFGLAEQLDERICPLDCGRKRVRYERRRSL